MAAPSGQVTPTTVTAESTFWAGVTAPDRAVLIGSAVADVPSAERVAFLADRMAATDDFTKPNWYIWLLTGWGAACEES